LIQNKLKENPSKNNTNQGNIKATFYNGGDALSMKRIAAAIETELVLTVKTERQ